MHSGSNFNIITGQAFTAQDSGRFKSAEQLMNLSTDKQKKMLRTRLPSLGTPKDKNKFQFTYFDKVQSPENDRNKSLSNINSPRKSITMNYTYQNVDLINHRELNPNFVNLNHNDFTNQLKTANLKGILTKHIDRSMIYSTNFHQGFEDRVKKNQFHRKYELCGNILDLEKGYGVSRYFRKYK